MRVALSMPPDEGPRLAALFAAALPDAEIVDAAVHAARADYVVCGHRDEALFDRQPAPKAVFTFSAGVGHLLSLPNFPAALPLVRLEDAGMAAQMIRYTLAVALRVVTRFDVYARQQRDRRWTQHPPRAPASLAAGVLGVGAIGGGIARAFAAQGFCVRGHSRSGRAITGVATYAGDDELDAFFSGLDIVVAVVPLTDATRGILNRHHLALLADGAHLVNIGRGGLLVDDDLLALLDEGTLGGATLDVFQQEPLPADHPFWTHPGVVVTPHVSGLTMPDEAVAQIAAKIARLERGLPVTGVVDRARGY